jgi:hypothetical protein
MIHVMQERQKHTRSSLFGPSSQNGSVNSADILQENPHSTICNERQKDVENQMRPLNGSNSPLSGSIENVIAEEEDLLIDSFSQKNDNAKSTAESILNCAKKFMTGKTNYRWKHITALKEKERKLVEDTELVMKYVASEDISFILEGINSDIILHSLKRRQAWNKYFFPMTLISSAQLTLCILVMLTKNLPITRGTFWMAVVYIVTISISNPFHVTKDLRKIYDKFFSKMASLLEKKFFAIGGKCCVESKVEPISASITYNCCKVACIVCALPLLLISFSATVIFDFLVGRIKDNSWQATIGTITSCVVISTGVSVGLRSGGPVGALQTFAGFSFIDWIDEEFLNQIHFDPYSAWNIPTRPEARKQKLVCRIILYTVVPCLAVGTVYVTLRNSCFVFCDSTTSMRFI